MRAGTPIAALLVNTHPYATGRSAGDYNDPSNEHKSLLTQSEGYGPVKGLYSGRKFSAVNWKNVLTIFITVVDYFLVYASISLIGAFFPTKVGDCQYVIICLCELCVCVCVCVCACACALYG